MLYDSVMAVWRLRGKETHNLKGMNMSREINYFGLRTDLVLSTKSEAQLFAIRDVASENEDWRTVDEIDAHLQERRRG